MAATVLEDIERLLNRMAQALGAADVRTLSNCRGVPAVVLSDEGVLPIADKNQVEQFFKSAIENYRSCEVVATKPKVEPSGAAQRKSSSCRRCPAVFRIRVTLTRVLNISVYISTRLALAIVVAITMGTSPSESATGLPLKSIADFALPGRPTRLDYQSLDAHRHLLFIAHLGDSVVIVFDTKARRVVTTIPGIAAVHGVLAVPSRNTVYASATGSDELVAIDEFTFKIKWRAPAGIYPDGIAYDPLTERLFVSDEHGNTITVIDATRGARIATIALGGEVGNTQYNPRSHHIFANVQGTTELVEIEPRSAVVIRRTHLNGCEGNHGLLIDAVNLRAFVACEDSSTFLWIDLSTMRTRMAWPTGSAPDVLALDAKANIIYVGSENGVVSIFRNRKTVTKMTEGFLAPAAHTVSVDPQSTLSYWPLQNVAGKPVLRIMELQR